MTAKTTGKTKEKAAKKQAASPYSALFGSVPIKLKQHVSPHGRVTAVSMMKDEGPYLIEWVAHHLAVGFTDLVVYTNDCSDGTDDMLIRLEELGLVHHRRNDIPEGLKPQPSALNYAQDEPIVQQSDWVMVFDADEFLSIRYGDGTIDGLISAAKDRGANGIVVTWRIFGSGGIVEWSRAPVTEQYLMAAPTTWNKGWGVKTLFTFDADHWKLGIHRPKMKNKHLDTPFPDTVHWLNGSGLPMEDYFKFRGWRSITRTVGYDWVQLNHYAVKSVDSYAIRKMRGNVNNKKDKYNSDYWSLQDRNEVRDETMLRYSAERNRIIDILLSDPILAGLHKAAVERAEARLAELKQTDAYRGLVSDLATASAVPISQIVAKPPQPRDREKIAALMSEVEKRQGEAAKAKRKAKAQPLAGDLGTYAASPIDISAEVPLEWVRNGTIDLPVDPRVFAPPVLKAISAGKFERKLARRLPQILPDTARLFEIGFGCGFHALHLSALRPDLSISIQEDDPGFHAVLAALKSRSGIAGPNPRALSDTLGAAFVASAIALIAREAPDVLFLSDPRATPRATERIVTGLGDKRPKMIVLLGRAIEASIGDLADFAPALASLGYEPAHGFDPKLAQAFEIKIPSEA
jgi:hypothetical protein